MITFTLKENVSSEVFKISLWTGLMFILDQLFRTFITCLAILDLHVAGPAAWSRGLRSFRKDYSAIPHPRPSKPLCYSLTTSIAIFPSSHVSSTQRSFRANSSCPNVWDLPQRKALKFQDRLGKATNWGTPSEGHTRATWLPLEKGPRGRGLGITTPTWPARSPELLSNASCPRPLPNTWGKPEKQDILEAQSWRGEKGDRTAHSTKGAGAWDNAGNGPAHGCPPSTRPPHPAGGGGVDVRNCSSHRQGESRGTPKDFFFFLQGS